MATRVNIDQRPKVLQFLGGAALLAGLLYGAQSVAVTTTSVLTAQQRIVEARGEEWNTFTYVGTCAKSEACLRTFANTWTRGVPAWERALYGTALLWGAGAVMVGGAWKPETRAMRRTRLASWKQFSLPEVSAKPPEVKS